VLRQNRFRDGRYAPISRLLNDPRLRLHYLDGRLALRSSEERYDVIEADTAHPSMAYSGNLYSREFFELARSRLNPGGLFCSMAPTARTLRTMVAVFPHVLDFHAPSFPSFIIGSNEPLQFDPQAIRTAFGDARVQRALSASGELDATRHMLERFLAQADVRSIAGAERIRHEGQINTDLFPADEFDLRYAGTYR
jgi:predicted membrane-bound spermidine synthase